MFVDLDGPLNASSLLSASAELLVDSCNGFSRLTWRYTRVPVFVFGVCLAGLSYREDDCSMQHQSLAAKLCYVMTRPSAF